MKRLLKRTSKDVFGMVNITPKRSGIAVSIWADHGGVNYRNSPRVKLSYQTDSISVSIEADPKILDPKSSKISSRAMQKLQEGIEYVGRNYDLFLKHYMDTDDAFDDADLFDALKQRGVFN